MSKPTVNVNILDEVNVVITNLLQEHIDHFYDVYAMHAPNYFFNPKYKLGVWDGKIRYFQRTGKTFLYLMDEMIPIIVKLGYKININDMRTSIVAYPPLADENHFKHILHPKTKQPLIMRDYQVEGTNILLTDGSGVLVAGTGSGKAQPLTSKVLTPGGWKRMGDIEVGMLVKTPANTNATVTHTFPQGSKQIYKMTFNDGSSARCCGDHLWRITTYGQSVFTQITETAYELIDRLKHKTTDQLLFIPICKPMDFEEVETNICPFDIGKHIVNGTISLLELPPTDSMTSNQRREILFGVVYDAIAVGDHDLVIIPTMYCDYVKQLSWSLGVMCYTKRLISHDMIELSFKFLQHWKNDLKFGRELISIVEDGIEEAKCICIDDEEHLYITDNFIVTHNTTMNACLVDCYGKEGLRTLTIVPDKTLINQTAEWFRVCELDTGVYYGDEKDTKHIHVVSTWQSLQNQPTLIQEFNVVVADECLDGNTMVLMGDGATKPIVCVRVDDMVVTLNEITNKYEKNRVVKQHINLTVSASEQMHRLEFDDGTVLEVTGNHKILTMGGYVRADELSENGAMSRCVTPTDRKIQLVKRTKIDHPEVVYNLHVENNHNYIANGIVVSNCHNVRGPVLQKLLNVYGPKLVHRFGLTGSLPKEKTDAMAVKLTLGVVKFTIPAHELIEQGHLSKLHIDVLQLNEDFTPQYKQFKAEHPTDQTTYAKFKNEYFPDYSSEKTYLQTRKERITWIAKTIDEKRQEKKGNLLCLVGNIGFGKKIQKMVPNSVFLNGKDPVADRKIVYDLFETSDNLCVFATIQIAGTGLSIDRIFKLVIIDLGKSFIRTIQSIGRGLRKSADKDFVEVVDLCSDLKYSKTHLSLRKSYYTEAKYPFTIKKIDYLLEGS